MRRKPFPFLSFPILFLSSLISLLVINAGIVYAQAGASAVRAIEHNGAAIEKNAPGVLAGIMALFTQNPVVAIIVVVVILGFIMMLSSKGASS